MEAEHVMEPDWGKLKAAYPPQLLDGLRQRMERADTPVVDPELLSKDLDSAIDATKRLLEEVAQMGLLLLTEEKRCGKCGAVASEEDQAVGICPNCGARYVELDRPFQVKHVFTLPAGRKSRDISWLVTVHGMNTDGPWQQDFAWLIAKKLKYSAPVLIFKYPILRVMALFGRTQRLACDDLGTRLRAAAEQAERRLGELRPTPDVILHSYGTLLFSELLLNPSFADLRFSRVILAGSIVRPDYDWETHVRSGRIEQVVNHCGDKDDVVFVAQLLVPNSGPSGRIGFVDQSVLNVRAVGYGHGTFFDLEAMRSNLAPRGSWDRFLTFPSDRLTVEDVMAKPGRWSESWFAAPCRIALKVLAIAGVGPLLWLGMQLWAAFRAAVWAK